MTAPDDEQPLASAKQPDPGAANDEPDPGWPWSFILLVVAGALYLIFRFVELGVKLFR